MSADALADLRAKLDDYYKNGNPRGMTRSQMSCVWELYHELRSDKDPKYRKPAWKGRR